MGIDITARHVEITDAVKEHARKKLARVVEEFPQVESIHVILDVEKYRYRAELVVQARRHIRLEAVGVCDDVYAAVDTAIDRIEKRLRREMDKRHDHKSRWPMSVAAEHTSNGDQNE
jgi:putative sigma-54 modulation protein